MNKLPNGERVIAEDEVWERMGEDSVFKKFVEYCLTRFIETNAIEDNYDIPDDIEEAFSDKLYVIKDEDNGTVRLSFNGDGYGEKFY